jgi:hypothetical protein
MDDPVLATDGHTYERAAILNWLNRRNKRSPVTNLPISNINLVSNIAIRRIIRNKNIEKIREHMHRVEAVNGRLQNSNRRLKNDYAQMCEEKELELKRIEEHKQEEMRSLELEKNEILNIKDRENRLLKGQVNLLKKNIIPGESDEDWVSIEKPNWETGNICENFLAAVVCSNRKRVKEMLENGDISPYIVTHKGFITDSGGREFKNITGLQYAVWALDWQTWSILCNKMNKKDIDSQIIEFNNKSEDYPSQHANWSELINQMTKLEKNWLSYSCEERNTFWKANIASEQRLLPAHVLHEYFNSFALNKNLNEVFLPNEENIAILDKSFFHKKNNSKTRGIAKGKMNKVEFIDDLARFYDKYQGPKCSGLNEDIKFLKNLYETRLKQYNEFLKDPKPNAHLVNEASRYVRNEYFPRESSNIMREY